MSYDPNKQPRGERDYGKWFAVGILIIVFGYIAITVVLNVLEGKEDRRIAAEQRATHTVYEATAQQKLFDDRATKIARNTTVLARPTATPRPPPTPKLTIRGLGVSLNEIRREFVKEGFKFNPIRDNNYQYGASILETANGSVAEIHISFNKNAIHRVQLKAYDVHIEPELAALHILLFLDVMLPEWNDAELARWAADASNKIERREIATHRRNTSDGYVQIEMEAISTTIFVTVSAE